jgi:hypothetical protein
VSTIFPVGRSSTVFNYAQLRKPGWILDVIPEMLSKAKLAVGDSFVLARRRD